MYQHILLNVCKLYIYNYIIHNQPGIQSQSVVSFSSPSHGLPSGEGGGFVHVLVLDFVNGGESEQELQQV